ncbi:MAG: hypothetical protein C4523_06520 [Myxococcales bacterium]|nr:MAG: hypothetical protein C4523_06520 [Myxococcales bacterium]
MAVGLLHYGATTIVLADPGQVAREGAAPPSPDIQESTAEPIDVVYAQVARQIRREIHFLTVLRAFNTPFDEHLIAKGLTWRVPVGNQWHESRVEVGRDYLFFLRRKSNSDLVWTHEQAGTVPPLPVHERIVVGSILTPELGFEVSEFVSEEPIVEILPVDLREKLRYDPIKKLLFFEGPMQDKETESLSRLFSSLYDDAAVNRLWKRSLHFHKIPLDVVEGWYEALAARQTGRELSEDPIDCPSPTPWHSQTRQGWTSCLQSAIREAASQHSEFDLLATYIKMLHTAKVPIDGADLGSIACGLEKGACKGDPTTSAVALDALADANIRISLPVMVRALEHQHAMVQTVAIRHLQSFVEHGRLESAQQWGKNPNARRKRARPENIQAQDVTAILQYFLMGASSETPSPTEYLPFPKRHDSPYHATLAALIQIGTDQAIEALANEFCNLDFLPDGTALCPRTPEQMDIIETLGVYGFSGMDAYFIKYFKRFDDQTQKRVSMVLNRKDQSIAEAKLIKTYDSSRQADVRLGVVMALATPENLSEATQKLMVRAAIDDPDETIRETAKRRLLKDYDISLFDDIARIYLREHDDSHPANASRRIRDEAWEWFRQMRMQILEHYLHEPDEGKRRLALSSLFLAEDNVDATRKICLERERGGSLASFCEGACPLKEFRCALDGRTVETCMIGSDGHFKWRKVSVCQADHCVEVDRSLLCEEEGGLRPEFKPIPLLSDQCFSDQKRLAVCKVCDPGEYETSSCVDGQPRLIRRCGQGTGYQMEESLCPPNTSCAPVDEGMVSCVESGY